MKSSELILLNFEEVRRRSIKVWQSIPSEFLSFRPDPEALSCIEMVQHVLASEYSYHQIIRNRGSIEQLESPFANKTFTNMDNLIDFAAKYRHDFINSIKEFTEEDLDSIKIDRTDLFSKGYTGYIRTLGDFFLRIAYHEAVHTGQLLDYLRTAGVERIDIWD